MESGGKSPSLSHCCQLSCSWRQTEHQTSVCHVSAGLFCFHSSPAHNSLVWKHDKRQWMARVWLNSLKAQIKQIRKLHIQYCSPNRITADEVKCKYAVCLCKWAASRRAGREARRHVRLQNSASFQTLISDVKCVCAHAHFGACVRVCVCCAFRCVRASVCVCARRVCLIDSPVLNPLCCICCILCSVCCSSLWTAAPNSSVTLSESYLDLFMNVLWS